LRIPAVFAVGGGNVAGLMLGLVSGAIASRVLGPTLRGELVIVQTWAGTAGVLLTLGVTQAVVIYTGSDSDLPRPLLLQAVVALALGFGLFLVLAWSGTQPWLSSIGILGGAALTAGMLMSSNAAGLAQRQGLMRREFQYVRLIPQVIGVLAIIWLWQAGNRDTNIWLLALGLAVLVPSSFMMISLLGGWHALKMAHNWTPPQRLVRQAGSAFLLVVGSSVIYRIDGLFVAVWMPSEKVALYAVAVAAAGVSTVIGQAVGMLVFSQLRGEAEGKHQRTVICRGTASALAATSAVAIPLIAIAPRAIQFVYGLGFVPAAGATRVLVLASIPLAADYLLVHALLSMGAGRRAFRIQVLAGLFTAVLLAAAIPTGRLVLVASVSVGVYSVSAILLFVAAMRVTSEPHKRLAVT
jgi:O-antigen/teichoic acid export membrane protein